MFFLPFQALVSRFFDRRRGLALATTLLISMILLILGLWPRRGTVGATLMLALWLFLPLALIFAFDLYKPAYLKFLLAVLPPFHLLLAAGVSRVAYSVFRC